MTGDVPDTTRIAAVIPAYNAAPHIAGVIADVRAHLSGGLIIVVDDGSTDDTVKEVEAAGGVELVRHEVNRGKGAALSSGIRRAHELGMKCAITLDADGQHNPAEIPKFVEKWAQTGAPVIVGNRMDDPKDMPRDRLWTNRVTSWVVSRLAGQEVPDSQNGYRLFETGTFVEISLKSLRYEAESEILIKAGKRGARIESVPVETIYGDEASSISPVRDTLRFFRMVMRALFW